MVGPIRVVVPMVAGGAVDILARTLGKELTDALGKQIVVENRPGASGTIGPTYLARNARADGYTIGQIPLTVFRMPYLEKVNYDPLKEFTWILGVTGYTFGVAVRSDPPWKRFKALIADARTKPGRISYASPGIGTSLHVTMEEIGRRDGVDWLHVPLKEGGVNQLLTPDNACLLVTHYQRMLNYIVPDYVHVMDGGRVLRTGGKELAVELETRGYDWIKAAA